MDYATQQKRNLIITVAITLAVCMAAVLVMVLIVHLQSPSYWMNDPRSAELTVSVDGASGDAKAITVSELQRNLKDEDSEKLVFTARSPEDCVISIGIKYHGRKVLASSVPIALTERGLVRDYGRRWTAYDGDRKYVRAIFRLYKYKDADSTEYINEFEVFIYEEA